MRIQLEGKGGCKDLKNDQRKMNAGVVDAEKEPTQVGIRCISLL